MRIHKRVIDFFSVGEAAQQLTHIELESGVNCDVKVADV